VSSSLPLPEPFRWVVAAAETSTVKGDLSLDGAQAEQQTVQSGMVEAEGRRPSRCW